MNKKEMALLRKAFAHLGMCEQHVKSTTINEKGQFGIVDTNLGVTVGFITNPDSKRGSVRITAFEPANIEIAEHCIDVLKEYVKYLKGKQSADTGTH